MTEQSPLGRLSRRRPGPPSRTERPLHWVGPAPASDAARLPHHHRERDVPNGRQYVIERAAQRAVVTEEGAAPDRTACATPAAHASDKGLGLRVLEPGDDFQRIGARHDLERSPTRAA